MKNSSTLRILLIVSIIFSISSAFAEPARQIAQLKKNEFLYCNFADDGSAFVSSRTLAQDQLTVQNEKVLKNTEVNRLIKQQQKILKKSAKNSIKYDTAKLMLANSKLCLKDKFLLPSNTAFNNSDLSDVADGDEQVVDGELEVNLSSTDFNVTGKCLVKSKPNLADDNNDPLSTPDNGSVRCAVSQAPSEDFILALKQTIANSDRTLFSVLVKLEQIRDSAFYVPLCPESRNCFRTQQVAKAIKKGNMKAILSKVK